MFDSPSLHPETDEAVSLQQECFDFLASGRCGQKIGNDPAWGLVGRSFAVISGQGKVC